MFLLKKITEDAREILDSRISELIPDLIPELMIIESLQAFNEITSQFTHDPKGLTNLTPCGR